MPTDPSSPPPLAPLLTMSEDDWEFVLMIDGDASADADDVMAAFQRSLKELEAQRAEVARLAALVPKWRPISEHNGTSFPALVGWRKARVVLLGWFDREMRAWRTTDTRSGMFRGDMFDPQPDCFMPLPAPPADAGEER